MTEPFIGSIQYFAFGYAPRGYALCNGATLQITSNQALYALLGIMYGGDGRTTFCLPDLQGRSITGMGVLNGTTFTEGVKGGAETAIVPAAALPTHTHTVTLSIGANGGNGSGTLSDPTNAYAAVADNGGAFYSPSPAANGSLGAPSVTVNPAGGGSPFNILSPYLALTCCIATSGLFPSRN